MGGQHALDRWVGTKGGRRRAGKYSRAPLGVDREGDDRGKSRETYRQAGSDIHVQGGVHDGIRIASDVSIFVCRVPFIAHGLGERAAGKRRGVLLVRRNAGRHALGLRCLEERARSSEMNAELGDSSAGGARRAHAGVKGRLETVDLG